MVTQERSQVKQGLELPNIPFGGGDASGTKWLIAAVLAAGKDGCQCPSCQFLKRFGGALSDAMLKEGQSSGDTSSVRA